VKTWKLFLFFLCIAWAMEEGQPFFTHNWPEWKRRIVFNPLIDKLVSLTIAWLHKQKVGGEQGGRTV